MKYEVIKKIDKSRKADGKDIRLIILAPIGLFSSLNLTTSSGMQLEDISHVQIGSSLYKLITSAKDTDDLSYGFDRERAR